MGELTGTLHIEIETQNFCIHADPQSNQPSTIETYIRCIGIHGMECLESAGRLAAAPLGHSFPKRLSTESTVASREFTNC